MLYQTHQDQTLLYREYSIKEKFFERKVWCGAYSCAGDSGLIGGSSYEDVVTLLWKPDTIPASSEGEDVMILALVGAWGAAGIVELG